MQMGLSKQAAGAASMQNAYDGGQFPERQMVFKQTLAFASHTLTRFLYPLQVMALIAYLMEKKNCYGPHLIIVPNAVMVNWKSELSKWLPSVRCVYYVGSKDERARL